MGDLLEGLVKSKLYFYNRIAEAKRENKAIEWNQLGKFLFSVCQLDEALEAFEIATDLNPEYEDAWYNVGITLLELERYQQAAETFEKVLKLNRNNSIAWYKFGIALHELGQLDKSKEAFENALDIKEIKNNGKMDEAEHVEHVSEKESIKTDDVLTHYRIGKVHIKHKMYIEALKEFLIELPAAYFIGGLKKWIHTWN